MRLVRNKFIAWLKARSPTELVGENRDCHSCPIAKFYYAASDGSEIVIFEDGWGDYRIDRGYSNRPLPLWAINFVVKVDDEENGQISAHRALEIME